MVSLHDYDGARLLRYSATSALYRLHRTSDGAPFVAKLVRDEYPTAGAQARLRHEHEVLRSFDVASIVRTHGLERCGNRLALILEDAGDRSLKTLIEAGPRPLQRSLEIAVRLAAALEAVHRQRVIHKDIRPEHFMLRDGDRAVTLIDFGIATRLTLENPSEVDSPEGTPAYMSPEQTGRMNRTVDRRSDLYSLGVTLYELFTGRHPFDSDDPLELVQCHIARTPRAPREIRPALPPVLSALVMKLLAKAAEDRYQGAGGLRSDLERCLAGLDPSGQLADFPLGQADVPDDLRLPQKLYGRDAQLAALLAAFGRARGGSAELMLVRGGSGTGKSVLVHELNKALVGDGRVAAGKFDQLGRDEPYAPILHGCRGLVRRLLARSPEQLAGWKQRLADALGPSGQLLIDLLPELEAVIGPQPAVQELPPSDSQRRFESTFQSFLQVFATADHPLVLFLDDLQWADAATLRLMSLLLTNPSTSHVLVIGAYRDGEVGPVHALSLALAEMRRGGAVIGEIEVAPLDGATVSQLLADALHAPASAVERLAVITRQKTHGNPFFVGQFITALDRQGIITFDAGAHRWTWDDDRIDRSMVTENVADFMVARFLELSSRARQLLERAACLGHEFDRNTLAVISERSADELATDLWEALTLGLIVPLDGNYRFAGEDDHAQAGPGALNAGYRFLHDRVQQAAYSLIDEPDRQAIQLRIGRLLLTACGGVPGGEDLFRIVDHLNVGAPHITDPNERRELARLNLRAGRRAQASAAHGAATRLYGHCLALLGEERWTVDYEAALSAHAGRAECEFLGGRIDEAFALLDRIDMHARTRLDRATGRSLKTTMLTALNRLGEAIACGVEGLHHLGMELPAGDASLGPALGAEMGGLMAALAGRDPAALLELPMMSDPEKLAAIELAFKVISPAYQFNQELMALLVLKATRLLLDHGNAPLSPDLYLLFGLVYGGATGDRRTGFRFAELALALSDRIKDRSGAGASSTFHFVFACLVSHWWRPITDSLEHFQRGLKIALESGDVLYVGYCSAMGLLYRYQRGENLEELDGHARAVAATLARNEDTINLLCATVVLRVIASLRGGASGRQGLEEESAADEALLRQIGSNRTVLAIHHVLRATSSYFAGDHRQALAHANQAEPLMSALAGHFTTVDHVLYRALASAGLLRSCDDTERAALIESLRRDEEVSRGWAADCPYNHAHRHALVAAELAAATGEPEAATDLYDRAIAEAAEHGYVHHQALASELCALFHIGRGRLKVARPYLLKAHDLYIHWGAEEPAAALGARHPILFDDLAAGARARSAGPGQHTVTGTRGGLASTFDLMTAIRASQAVASELVPDRLVERVLRTLIASAGARRGLLITVRDERLEIAARVTIEPDEVRLGLGEVGASGELAATVVQYVARTGEVVVLGDAAAEGAFRDDPYVARNGARSILCIPMTHQGRLTGILYLENEATTACFSPQGVELLRFLAAQAAVAMENSKLYAELHAANETLERRVEARTRELADSREQYRVLLETTEAIPWEMEPEALRFTYVGPQALEILGYPAHEWTRDGFLTERLAPEERAQGLEGLRRASERDGHDELDLCLIAAEGRPVWFRCLVTTTRDGAARAVLRGILLDVTERRRLEVELRAAQKLESVGRLAAGIAHEVNTPVQFVSDSVQFVSTAFGDLARLVARYQDLMRDGARPGDQVFADLVAEVRLLEEETDLEYVLENVPSALARSLDGLGRIATIVRSMKMFSHPDQKEKCEVDLNENIRSTLIIAAHEYKQLAALRTDFGSLPAVVCHAGEINQVVLNLIVNASHAIAEVPRADDALGEIGVRTWQEGDEVVISVSDTGGGIPERVRDKIFEPFFTTKEVGRGTGQGLSIARAAVVDKHGGQIWFTTELGRGTTFFVRLPIRGQAVARTAA